MFQVQRTFNIYFILYSSCYFSKRKKKQNLLLFPQKLLEHTITMEKKDKQYL